MSNKRTGNFNGNATKKFKPDENYDSLWGEDLEEDDVEECLLLATQIVEQNVSALPNYSFFKQNDDVFASSTQAIPLRNNELTRNNEPTRNVQDLERTVEKLKEDVMTREGEVSILRSQLKQLRAASETERLNKEREISGKLESVSKELSSAKSELDFKNLEIVNLRNKITELTKFCHTNSIWNGSNAKGETTTNRRSNCIIYAELENDYPLSIKINSEIFLPPKKEYLFLNYENNCWKFNNDNRTITQYEANLSYNNIKLDFIFPYVSLLIKSNKDELNSESCNRAVEKIFRTALEILQIFDKYLSLLEFKSQKESNSNKVPVISFIDKSNTSSIFGNEEWNSIELGVKLRRIIAVLSEILPYNQHLGQLISNESNSSDNFFYFIQSIIKNISNINAIEYSVGLLCSIVMFTTKCLLTSNVFNCDERICDTVNEILLHKPPVKTLEYMEEFFKASILQRVFLQTMCVTTENNHLFSISTSTLSTNKDTCLLRLYYKLYRNSPIKVQLSISILQFVKHLLNSNEDQNRCTCLKLLIKIVINVLYEAAKRYIKEKRHRKFIEKHQNILKYSVNLLHLIKFNHLDVFNNYKVLSQYKFIVNTLQINSYKKELADGLKQSPQDEETLKELVLYEEQPKIHYSVLNKIPIW